MKEMDAVRPQTDKSIFYRYAKTVVLLLVVLGHCLTMYTDAGAIPVMRGSEFLAAVQRYIYGFHVPVFFMMSGAVFGFGLSKGKYQKFLPFVKKKFFRLLVPFFLIALLCVYPVELICGLAVFSPVNLIYNIINIVLGGHGRHLWFIYALFVIFILAYPLRRVFSSSKLWPVLLTVSFAVSIISRYLPYGFLSYCQLGNALYYQFFFFAGMCIDCYYGKIAAGILKYPVIPLLAALLLALRCFTGQIIPLEYLYAALGFIALAGFIIPLGGRMEASLLWRNAAKDAYGIYLFHAMLIYLVFYAFSGAEVNPLLLVLAALTISVGVSVLLTRLCRRLGCKI